MECEQTADCRNSTLACSNSELRIFQAGVNPILNLEGQYSVFGVILIEVMDSNPWPPPCEEDTGGSLTCSFVVARWCP